MEKERPKYNGKPLFNVGFLDFNMFVTQYESNARILSKNIQSDELREHYKKSRNNDFVVCYEGVIVELKKLGNQHIDEDNG